MIRFFILYPPYELFARIFSKNNGDKDNFRNPNNHVPDFCTYTSNYILIFYQLQLLFVFFIKYADISSFFKNQRGAATDSSSLLCTI